MPSIELERANALGRAAGKIWRQELDNAGRERVTRALKAWSPFGLSVSLRGFLQTPILVSVAKRGRDLIINLNDNQIQVSSPKSKDKTILSGPKIENLFNSLITVKPQENIKKLIRRGFSDLAKDIETDPELFKVLRVEESVTEDLWDIAPDG
jgi:hypothetical protein